MKNFLLFSGMLCGMTTLLCGCLGPSITYQGANFTPTTSAIFIKDKTIPQTYKSIGTCTISGSYENYTLDELKSAALKKAESVGADAVMIKTYEVVKDGMARESQITNMAGSGQGEIDDDSSDGWQHLSYELNADYSEVGAPRSMDLPIYKRILRVEFLRKNP